MPADSTSSPCSTNSASSAAKPAATSGAAVAVDACRSSRRCTRCWPSRARPSARARSDRRRIFEGHRDGREGPGDCCAASIGVPDEKIEIIPHGIPEFPFVEPDAGKGQARLRRPIRHSDVRPAVSQQGHRGHDRCDAGDPEQPARRRLRRARSDASQSGARSGRGLSREPGGARARTGNRRTMSSFSTSSSIRRHCSNSFRCAMSTSRPISMRRR